ncbi:hypothetical protein ABZ736_27750 [Streptomyces sp. NPDC013099]|uniref:hypothetical protein n=1 Tax=Streptomyces sp. NPDC013099 TaxID=3156687 RepID=UPI0033F1C5BC
MKLPFVRRITADALRSQLAHAEEKVVELETRLQAVQELPVAGESSVDEPEPESKSESEDRDYAFTYLNLVFP